MCSTRWRQGLKVCNRTIGNQLEFNNCFVQEMISVVVELHVPLPIRINNALVLSEFSVFTIANANWID